MFQVCRSVRPHLLLLCPNGEQVSSAAVTVPLFQAAALPREPPCVSFPISAFSLFPCCHNRFVFLLAPVASSLCLLLILHLHLASWVLHLQSTKIILCSLSNFVNGEKISYGCTIVVWSLESICFGG